MSVIRRFFSAGTGGPKCNTDVITFIPEDKKANKNLVINTQKSIKKCYLGIPLRHTLVARTLEIYYYCHLLLLPLFHIAAHVKLILTCALLRIKVQRIPINVTSSPSCRAKKNFKGCTYITIYLLMYVAYDFLHFFRWYLFHSLIMM